MIGGQATGRVFRPGIRPAVRSCRAATETQEGRGGGEGVSESEGGLVSQSLSSLAGHISLWHVSEAGTRLELSNEMHNIVFIFYVITEQLQRLWIKLAKNTSQHLGTCK